MTSLAEAYNRQGGEVSRRRLYLGTGLFVAGALLVVAGLVAVTTTVLTGLGASLMTAREIGGVLAGLGLPAVFLGVFTVLPASTAQRAAAVVGAAVAVLGVMVFRYAYPTRWYGPNYVPSSLTVLALGIYFLGILVTFWCLFTAIATFKRRNDPGGTVSLTYQQDGETHTLNVAAADAAKAKRALGGVGVFGGVDDPAAASDGGSSTDDITHLGPDADDGEVLEEPSEPTTATDRYCGNCTHFDYVRTDQGMQPYCGHYDELMDDMDACEEWTPR